MSTLQDATWAAEKLNISRARVYDLVRKNVLPHVKLGKQIKFDPLRLEAFINEGGRGLE